jgi:hypothetical protein
MDENSIVGSTVLLIAGGIIGAVTAWRLWFGRSYISNPAMQVSRKVDPFSFWLSLVVPAAASLFLIAAGLVWLIYDR